MTESQVLKAIIKKIKANMILSYPDIIWWERLQSLRMGTITVGKPGNPDLVLAVNQGNGGLALLFLEVKRSGTTRLRFEQKEFFMMMAGKPKVLCRVINDPAQLGPYIKECKNL